MPGVAAAAKQMGKYVAGVISARIAGKPVKPFRYINYGNLATIGRKAAVADFGWMKLSAPGLAAMDLRTSLVPGQLPQSDHRLSRLGLGLHDL